MSLRIIIISGVGIFAVMALIPFALKRGLQPDPRQRVQVLPDASPFNGDTAYEHVKALVAHGPRATGSEALRTSNSYIVRHLRALGVRTEQVESRAPGTGSPPLLNVVGTIDGTRKGVVLLGCHYDTYVDSDPPSPGANAGASGPAVLLELARVFGGRREGLSLWLCFWDGGEAYNEGRTPMSGSATHLQQWQDAGRLADLRAAVILDAVGDCYLGIQQDPEAPPWLREAVWSVASVLGYDRHFFSSGESLLGDQTSTRHFNIPTLTLTDSRYGGSIVEHRRYWHTAEDTADKVCPGSLQAVGDVIYHALLTMDALNPAPPRL